MARTPIRPARVASLLQEVVARAITFDVQDPRVAGVIITEVEVSGDLQEARVYFHLDGDAKRIAEAAAGLERASGFLRRAVGEHVRLRHTPRLTFRHDASLEYAARIEQRLAELGFSPAGSPASGGVPAADDADDEADGADEHRDVDDAEDDGAEDDDAGEPSR